MPKSKDVSVVDMATEIVEKWSDTKRAAWEQRTGLMLPLRKSDRSGKNPA